MNRRYSASTTTRLTNQDPNISRNLIAWCLGAMARAYGPGKGRPLATCVVVVSSDESDEFFYLIFSEEA
jgi:hypothetical protein